MFLCAELSTRFLITPSLLSAKSILLCFSWPISLNACSFFGLYSVEIKSDDGYQIGRRISSDLYHVISFIQWEPEESIQTSDIKIQEMSFLKNITFSFTFFLNGVKIWIFCFSCFLTHYYALGEVTILIGRSR